jgi:hypothetical protein
MKTGAAWAAATLNFICLQADMVARVGWVTWVVLLDGIGA